MILDWLKRVFGFAPNGPTSAEKDADKKAMPKSPYENLDNRRNAVKVEKEQLKTSDIGWYSLIIPMSKERKPFENFHPYKFKEIVNLKTLKEQRLKREAHELKTLEDEVKLLLGNAERQIEQRKADEAKISLALIIKKITKTKDIVIRQRHQLIQLRFYNLVSELEREELVRQAEEKRRKEEEAQRQKEAEERAKKEKEKKEREEREKRQAEAKRFTEEARQKENTEREERQRLEALSSDLKEDWQAIIQVLNDNGIKYLYHFTDRSNIPLIKRYGGLLSWSYCDKHGIRVPKPGGDQLSRQLDVSRDLQDYVRICFTREHPMKYIAKNDGRITDPVNLIIDIKAACIAGTLYSNKNATIKREHVNIGSTIDDLKQIHFRSVKAPTHFDLDDDERSYFQAEIMIKTFLSKKFIVNLDNY